MKRRILSIDFDYFIDTDLVTRENKFPDGVDVKPKAHLKIEWDLFYEQYPELKEIGVIPNFELMKKALEYLRFGEVVMADSHRDIGKLFPRIKVDEDLEVIHIDFHHDNYLGMSHEIDCSNWVRVLMDSRENLDSSTRIEWVRREDSETSSLAGDFPYISTEDFVINGEFDYIFLCFSPEWTPPHLYPKYVELCQSTTHLMFE